MTARPISPLSQTQWLALATKAESARAALEDLSLALLYAMPDSDAKLAETLVNQSGKVDAAKHSILSAYFYQPQTEWLGGDPANVTLREGISQTGAV
jgi:hypothetical protein